MKKNLFMAILIISRIASGGVLKATYAQKGEDAPPDPFRNDLRAIGAHVRTEWPELLHKNRSAIFTHFLDTLGVGKDPDFAIFVQKPLPKEQTRPQQEDDTDVWLYITHDDVVYEIPRHGRWHPNRISPGWPELKGVHYIDAIRTIMDDMPGVLVDYGPLKRRKPKGTHINRVVLYVNDYEKVARIPHVG